MDQVEILASVAKSKQFKTRLQAFSAHLAVSLVIFAVLLFLLVTYWYPGPLFYTDGGIQGLWLILGCDLVLGPLITLVIFNPEKARKLVIFDLSVIATIQMSALTFGVWSTWQSRPAGISFHEKSGVFKTIYVSELKTQGKHIQQLAQTGNTKLPIFFVEPAAADDTQGLMKSVELVQSGIYEWSQFDLLHPLDQHLERFLTAKKRDAKLFEQPFVQEEIRHFSATSGQSVTPAILNGHFGNRLLLISQQGELIDHLAWEVSP